VSCRFPKERRLRKRREFVAVQAKGTAVPSANFVVVLRSGGCGRVGLTVSKKVGNAVVRNRVKRLLREFVRTLGSDSRCDGPASGRWLPEGKDVVIIARRGAVGLGQCDVNRELGAQEGRLAAC